MNLPPIQPSSTAARALSLVWGGQAGTVVAAGPGAGKSTLVTQVVKHLVQDAGLDVVVATPTREQAYALGTRLHQAMGPGWVSIDVKGASHHLDRDTYQATRDGRLQVRTIDSCRYSTPTCDVFVADEGYQATFAQLTAAARGATQMLVVGDAGQIGPVVSADVSSFESWGARPHHRAPDVLACREDFVTLHLGQTYRLGPETTKVVDILYDFDLVSGRPPRYIQGQPEIKGFDMGDVEDLNDRRMLGFVAQRAVELATSNRVEADGSVIPMTDNDVAVVVSRNTQVSLVTGLLDAAGHPGITVGSANKLQGGEWPAVVAVDPLAGIEEAADRDVANGLLCVMISRPMHHLTWVHANGWVERLQEFKGNVVDLDRAYRVRKALATFD